MKEVIKIADYCIGSDHKPFIVADLSATMFGGTAPLIMAFLLKYNIYYTTKHIFNIHFANFSNMYSFTQIK